MFLKITEQEGKRHPQFLKDSVLYKFIYLFFVEHVLRQFGILTYLLNLEYVSA